jgi:hypothetical protein
LARFLARLKKLKSFCWRLLRCVSGAGEWGARGAGALHGRRGASILLGGGDPFQPVLPKIIIRNGGNAILRYLYTVPIRPIRVTVRAGWNESRAGSKSGPRYGARGRTNRGKRNGVKPLQTGALSAFAPPGLRGRSAEVSAPESPRPLPPWKPSSPRTASGLDGLAAGELQLLQARELGPCCGCRALQTSSGPRRQLWSRSAGSDWWPTRPAWGQCAEHGALQQS